MKLSDFDKIEKLVSQRTKLIEAMEQCSEFEEYDKNDWGNISVHKDGSGASVNLIGCGVLYNVVKATKVELGKKKEEVESTLYNLGVEVWPILLFRQGAVYLNKLKDGIDELSSMTQVDGEKDYQKEEMKETIEALAENFNKYHRIITVEAYKSKSNNQLY